MHYFPEKCRLHFCLIFCLLVPHTILAAADVPIIAAASSVKFALHDITEAFFQETGKSVRISYSSSGNLSRQIQQGAPFELFLSANSRYITQLKQLNKTQGQAYVFAVGRLALLSANNSPIMLDQQLQGLKHALQDGDLQRFAIANPQHAPYGVAAREVLQHLDLWELAQPHLVLGENVAQATQFASSGAAQVGLVSYSLALTPNVQKRTQHQLLPESLHQPLLQTMVLLKQAGTTAKLFFIYLQQEKARSILSRYGYTTPKG